MNLDLLVDLHKHGKRQGPGCDEQTRKAIEVSGLLKRSEKLHIADIGCGTGASTLVLAKTLDAEITAVDLFTAFLSRLTSEAKDLGHQITTLACAMNDLPFTTNSLDCIWSEGAIYNMGFENGITYLKHFLKPKGILAVSEITWFTAQRPADLMIHWKNQYPEIGLASDKIRILEMHGFMIKGYFPLPSACWWDNYYDPISQRFDGFLTRHNHSKDAHLIVDSEIHEMNLYRQHHKHYGYGFYVAEKV